MGEFKARQQPELQNVNAVLSERISGSQPGAGLDALKATLQRHFGGTPFAAIADVTARHVGIIAGNIDHTLGISRFFGAPAYQPHAATISEMAKQAVMMAQQGQMQIALTLIKEADEKLEGAKKIAKREKELEEAERNEKGMEEGKKEELVEALHSSFSDLGTATAERAELIGQAVGFYAQNMGALELPELKEQKKALLGFITSLGKEAKEKAPCDIQAKRGELEQIAGAVTPPVKQRMESALNGVSEAAESVLRMMEQRGISKEFMKALDGIRKLSSEIRDGIKEGRIIAEDQVRKLDAMVSYAKSAFAHLSGIGTRLRGPTSDIHARAARAIEAGDEKAAAAQGFLAKEFVLASEKARDALDGISASLDSGKIKVAEALDGAAKYISGVLKGKTSGIKDAGILGSLNKVFGRLDGGSVTVTDVEGARLAADLAGDYKKDGSGLANNKKAKEGSEKIYGRAFSSIARGVLDFASKQGRLAKLFGKKRMSGVRNELESASGRMDTIGKLKQMHQLIKEGMKPEEAALLCADGDEGLLEQYNSMQDAAGELQKAEQTMDLFIFAAEARSEFAKRKTADESGIYDAAVDWLDSRIIGKIASGEEPAQSDIQAFFALLAMHEGSAEGMEKFMLSAPEAAGLMSGTHGMEAALKGLHGEDKMAVQDMFWSAQQSLFDGRFVEAAGHVLAANAAARLKGADRGMLEKLSYAVACEGTETAETLLWIGRAQLDKAAFNDDARKGAGAYFDLSIMAFRKGDFNGANTALSLAKLSARALEIGASDPRAQDSLGMAREILGDYRNLDGRLLFGDGQVGGLMGGDATLMMNLETAGPGAGETIAALSKYPKGAKLSALSLRIEKAGLELGRAEMGAMLLAVSDPKFHDIYQGQEDRYRDKAHLAEKSGKGEKAEALLEEAERTVRAKELAGESAQAYETGAGMKEQEIDRMLEELANGGEPQASERFQAGAAIMALAGKSMSSTMALHDSIVNVRTERKEEGRAELSRAAESFLKAAATLANSGFADASLIAYASADMDAGLAGVANQKFLQRTAKQVEQKLLGIISECREENGRNKADFIDTGLDAPSKELYTDEGVVHTGETGHLVDYGQREKDLDSAEDDAKKHRFNESYEHISIARLGIGIDRFRGTVEREYRRLNPKVEVVWSSESFEAIDVMKEFGYDGMMKDLFKADARLKEGDLEWAGSMIKGFDTRLMVNATAQELALEEWTLGKVATNLGDMAQAAMEFGMEPGKLRGMGFDFSGDFEGARKKYSDYQKAMRPVMKMTESAHDENVSAARALSGAFVIGKKAAALKKDVAAAMIDLKGERQRLRESEKNGNAEAVLKDREDERKSLAKEWVILEKRFGRFSDGFQIWSTCAGQALAALDGIDSIEKTRGYENASQLRYEQMRDSAAVLGQLAYVAADEPEKIVSIIGSGVQVGFRMPSGKLELRGEHGGYAAVTLEFTQGSGSFAELMENALGRTLKIAELMAEGGHASGEKDQAGAIAKKFTGLSLASVGLVKRGGVIQKVKYSARERDIIAQALNGNGGANEITGMFFSAPATLTSFFSTEESGSALDALGRGLGDNVAIIDEITKARMRNDGLDSAVLDDYSKKMKESGVRMKEEFGAQIKGGQSTESNVRALKAVFDLALSAGLTVTGFGSVAGVYGGTMALKDLAFQSDRAGGFDNLSTFDQAMGVANVTLGFADGATSYLGELGKGASEMTRGAAVLEGRLIGARFDRTLMSFMPGGKGATWTGRILGGTSVVTGGISAYKAAGSYGSGDMGLFEFGVTLMGSLQPVVDHGSAALGKKMLTRLADNDTPSNRKWVAGVMAKGFIRAFTGNSVAGDAQAYRRVEALEEHGRSIRQLDAEGKAEYEKTAVVLERAMGRSLEAEEATYLASIIKGGAKGYDAAIDALANPKAQADFEGYLIRKAGGETDESGLGADELELQKSIRNLDKDKAWDEIWKFEQKQAKKALGGEELADAMVSAVARGREVKEKMAESEGVREKNRTGLDSEFDRTQASLGEDDARRFRELTETFWILARGEPSADDKIRLDIQDKDILAISSVLNGAKDGTGQVKGDGQQGGRAGGVTVETSSSGYTGEVSKEHVASLLSYLARNYSTRSKKNESEYAKAQESITKESVESRIGTLQEAFGFYKEGKLTAAAKARLGIGDSEIGVFSQMTKAGKHDAVRLIGESALPDEAKEIATGQAIKDSESRGEASKERVDTTLGALARARYDVLETVESEIGYGPGSTELEAELRSRESSASGRGGLESADAQTIKVARTLERMLGQKDYQGAVPAEVIESFCAGYPEYANALKNLATARRDELPHLIRMEAQAIVNGRKSAEIESAILESGIDEKTADIARAIHKSLHGEPVEADLAYLDHSVMERVHESLGAGLEEADAIVETAVRIKNARDLEGAETMRGEELELRRIEKEADSLGSPQRGEGQDAQIVDLDSRRKEKESGPEPPDGPQAQSEALLRTGTDDRVELVGGVESDEITEGAVVMGPRNWFGRKEKGTARDGLEGSVKAAGAESGSAGGTEGAALRQPGGAETLAPGKIQLSGIMKDARSDRLKEEYMFESLEGKMIKVKDAPQATLIEQIGSGSGCEVYRGQMVVDGQVRDVAVKVTRVRDAEGKGREDTIPWDARVGIAANEIKLLKIAHEIGIGPAVYGFVEVGGNPAIAMELVKGKHISEMSADEIRKNVSQVTFDSVGDAFRKMKEGGYIQDDFQFLVLTEDQEIGGTMRRKGEVVFIDIESLKTIGKSERYDLYGDAVLQIEVSGAKAAIDKTFFEEYYPKNVADAVLKADVAKAVKGVTKLSADDPVSIARFIGSDSKKRIAAIEGFLSGLADRKESERIRKSLAMVSRESGVQLLADADMEAGTPEKNPALGSAELARLARDMIVGKEGAQDALKKLSEEEKGIVDGLAADTKFILNAKVEEKTFERFISNKRTGAKLIEDMVAKGKKK